MIFRGMTDGGLVSYVYENKPYSPIFYCTLDNWPYTQPCTTCGDPVAVNAVSPSQEYCSADCADPESLLSLMVANGLSANKVKDFLAQIGVRPYSLGTGQ